ncbi:phosphatidylinositol transfer protein csr1 [Conoideocrella luteorostrata]|uniref:Phosphatidylinositol transfer protein csr1 n=1 Tax=Conoideocrella luteorostrata TaxID=1105319 RepID=A0AAJ0CXC1_9HYPO|nr:phosphatidylinositol transfer protein csr1 [Conoideocrella luteorostrata]
MTPEVAPGHLGNLTLEQEDKLRQLWQAIFKICGVHGGSGTVMGDTSATIDEKPAAEPEAPKKKRGFGFFKSSSQQNSSIPSNNTGADATDDDKYGLTKQYREILANQKPEDIREILWAMMKHDHPDALVLRFLRARKWDVEKALVMLISAMSWRHSKMKVDQDIMKHGEAGAAASEKGGDEKAKKIGQDFLKQSRMGKSFLHGIDKEGRPICIVRVRLHRASEQSPESLERYTVFIIETARLTLKPPVDTANIIFDMSGFTLANMDYHPVKFMIQCFEANYPESLGVVLVHNAPWVFQGIWKIIRGWLDPVVAAKVHFTNYRAGLEEFINSDQIIKDFEGDEDWKYEYQEPVEGENNIMNDKTTRDRLLGERQHFYAQFEDNTLRWISHPSGPEAQTIKAEREGIAASLRDGYWRLDPYVRARSLYDRQGIIRPDGDVDWYRKVADSKEASSVNAKSAADATGMA